MDSHGDPHGHNLANVDSEPLTRFDLGDNVPRYDQYPPSTGQYADWDAIMRDLATDPSLPATDSFHTSLPSPSPNLSTSIRQTPDTVVSTGCESTKVYGEDANDTATAAEAIIGEANSTEESQQHVDTAFPDSAANDEYHPTASPAQDQESPDPPQLMVNPSQPTQITEQHFSNAVAARNRAAAANIAASIAAGANVYTAASFGHTGSAQTLVMNASPRGRFSRLPPDIGPDGEIKYLEPEEVAKLATRNIAPPNYVPLPPDLEKHMYYPDGRGPGEQSPAIPPPTPVQSQSQAEQLDPTRYGPGPQQFPVQRQPLQPQQYQPYREYRYPSIGSNQLATQSFNGASSSFNQQPQHSQNRYPQNQHPQTQNQRPLQHPQYGMGLGNGAQNCPQFRNPFGCHSGSQAPDSIPQSMQQPMLPMPVGDPSMELYYTADGVNTSLNRSERPPDINSHEYIRNRDFRAEWSFGQVYPSPSPPVNWLENDPNIIEPHARRLDKKNIKLGMSSQDATKAAITDGFVRGAAWAVRLFLKQMEKEMKEKGTMLGFKPHKKMPKIELEKAVVEHIVNTNPPSIHGAQCANAISWAYDEFYPGVFQQEGPDGKRRGPEEILGAWKSLVTTVSSYQLKAVVLNTSTGLTVMTDKQPTRPPVAQVRGFATTAEQGPVIKMAQFPGSHANVKPTIAGNGQSFFTQPEGPATMALQQMRRAGSAASNSRAKPQGAKMPPKTAEEKKTTRNRKADDKIGWILTGAMKVIEVNGVSYTSYACSDKESRILEGQRLEEAKERTAKAMRKHQEAKVMAAAAGTAPAGTSTAAPMAAQPGPASYPRGPFSATVGPPQWASSDSTPNSVNDNMSAQNGEMKRKRAPDQESMPTGRKKGRKSMVDAIREARSGA